MQDGVGKITVSSHTTHPDLLLVYGINFMYSIFPTSRIDHWDLEREKLVILTDNNLIVVKYNFINSSVEELKYIPFSHVTEVVYGDFKYTSSFVL